MNSSPLLFLAFSMEKEEAFKKILELDRQLDAKQKLKMEIEELKGRLQVGDDELKAKMEEIVDIEDMNQTLIMKQRQSYYELQEARKELIEGLQDMLSGRTNIGVKRMGEIDMKAFHDACKEKFDAEEAPIKAVELCTLWQDKLKNLEWYPLKMVAVDGGHEGLQDMLSGRTNIGVKRMGEIDMKAFHDACKEKFDAEEALIKAVELCTLWQDKLKNLEWYPLKMVAVDGGHE
ncbi:factor of DNA methylation 1-like protein, partial [Tanacetum coccineum]